MTIGPIQFDQPAWLLLAPALIAVAWLIARKAIAGLSPALRRTAFGIRAFLITLIVVALAAPSWRKGVDDVAVLVVLDMSESMPSGFDRAAARYIEETSRRAQQNDRLGLVLTASKPLVADLPSSLVRTIEPVYQQAADATDLAAAVRLATAVLPQDAAPRIVVISDGNETEGGLLAAAEAAKAAGVVVDVLPVTYDIAREVVVDQIIAPANARRGQTVNLRFAITATRPTVGRLSLFSGDIPIDLDPDAPGDAYEITLDEGVNVPSIPVTLPARGAQRFRAVFEPLDATHDAIADNNTAEAVTFVTGEGRVLLYADAPEQHAPLIQALADSGLEVDVRQTPADFTSLVDLAGFDAVILAGTESYGFSLKQQDELRAYVHDIGGGLVVIGGPDALGAGGWIGSPLADALPLKLDPPQQQQHLRGALALIMHSCEMPEGNYWAQQTGIAAINALTRLDLVGVLEYSWNMGGAGWAFPLQEKGDGSAPIRAINSLSMGDMPDFVSAMQLALTGLKNVEAGHKHAVIFSDGDPSGPGSGLVQQFIDAGISISTICVFPHGMGNDVAKMQSIATATGGNFYFINNRALTAQLPQIFIKEAQTVLRALIWEGDPSSAVITAPSESLRGVGSLPPYSGYVVTTPREGLSLVTAQTHQGDPLLAQWQHGLGRAVVYTSDAASRWNADWTAWQGFRSFWEQHVRWAMRPTGSANLNIVTQQQGDSTRVIVEALDPSGEPLNFASFRGRVVGPTGESVPVELRMTAPGRYEGAAATPGAGVHTLNLQYDASGSMAADDTPESRAQLADRGSIQAAIVKPQAAERRTLTSNASLLERVAQSSGGRVLTGDPANDDLFAREGLPRAVATRSIWLPLALLALGVFLVDVAVRRVRIDRESIAALAQRFTRREHARSEAQVGALRTAREKARERTSGEDKPSPSKQTSRKFEAAPDAPVSDEVQLDTAKPASRTPDLAAPKEATSDDENMSRLLKAKRRAQQSREQNPDHRSIDDDQTT